MLAIKKEYIVTDDNKKKAALIDIDTFNKMEEIIENYGLAKYMTEVANCVFRSKLATEYD